MWSHGLTDDEIMGYEEAYRERKKELAIMWSLMAFSAGVVEAVIVTDHEFFEERTNSIT